MTKCSTSHEGISARIDGSLAPEDERALDVHLDTCGPCRKHAARLELGRAAVATLEARVVVPAPLVARIETLALRLDGERWHRRHRVPLAVGICVVTAAALMLILWPPTPRSRDARHSPELSTILVDDHLRYLPKQDANDFPSSDRKAVQDWFAARLDFAFPVPVLADARLRGGRLCFVDGRRVGLLFYERHGVRISMFVLPEARLEGLLQRSDGTWAGSRHGVQVQAIAAHGVTYALVSELPAADLRGMWGGPVDR